MSSIAIDDLLSKAFPNDIAQRLMRLARPAIGLWPQRSLAEPPATASRFGGMPIAPASWSWPMVESEPMLFLGQINCAELAGMTGAEKLPSSGLLTFFADHDAVMGCGSIDSAVFHWSDTKILRPATPPVEVGYILPVCALAFRPMSDLPDPYSRIAQAILPNADQASRYAKVVEKVRSHGIPDDLVYYCAFGKLFGWPALVQQHDVDEFGDGPGVGGLNLLLQLDDYCNGEQTSELGPGGSLYFLIRDKDLTARRFDRCEFDGQFT
jgi:Domain of unknown function (DUF1963)